MPSLIWKAVLLFVFTQLEAGEKTSEQVNITNTPMEQGST